MPVKFGVGPGEKGLGLGKGENLVTHGTGEVRLESEEGNEFCRKGDFGGAPQKISSKIVSLVSTGKESGSEVNVARHNHVGDMLASGFDSNEELDTERRRARKQKAPVVIPDFKSNSEILAYERKIISDKAREAERTMRRKIRMKLKLEEKQEKEDQVMNYQAGLDKMTNATA